MSEFRIERDSMGELKIPQSALYGAQTQRAIENFPISGRAMPRAFIAALGLIKAAAAQANAELGHLDTDLARVIEVAALAVAEGRHDAHFPVDVYQTGSGTSSNMNANEVIARLASAGALSVHPNDHVNFGQSSNDVIPTAIQVAAAMQVENELLPALQLLIEAIAERADELKDVVKTGRTHLMDAMPLRFDQELGAWVAQLRANQQRLRDTLVRVRKLPLGGTAVGTGINADPGFAEIANNRLSVLTGLAFSGADNLFAGIAAKDESVELSGQLKTLACTLMKIANDLRWMNSGPIAGLGEIELPALQPGSSIMPGKVNPVIPEALAMVCARVMGNDVTIGIAGQSGNFQLNVMLPLIADSLLESVGLMAKCVPLLAEKVIAGFRVRMDQIHEPLAKNPVLITALNALIGYERGAKIAKRAYAEGRPIFDVARESLDLDETKLLALLDPKALTYGGFSDTELS